MLLRLFKGNSPAIIFLIAVTFIALWISVFIHPVNVSSSQNDTNSMPLYGLLKQLIGKNYHVGVFISFSIVTVIAFLLVNFNITSYFINERTYLPSLLYILSGGVFPQCQYLNPVLPASLLLMFAMIRIMDGYRRTGVAYSFFDAGILIGTGSLFYANLIWFGLLLIIGIVLLKTVNIAEIAVSILGLLTPILLTFGLYYVMGKDLRVLLSLVADNLFSRTEGYLFQRLTIIALIVWSIIIVVSISYLFMVMNSKKIISRKTFSMMIWVFLISVAVYFVLPPVSVEIVWITGIPVCYFLAHYFINIKKKLVTEIFFSVLFILTLVIQIVYLKLWVT